MSGTKSLIGELSEAIIAIFEDAVDTDDFTGCKHCDLVETCETNELVCAGAVRGLLVGRQWEPKEPTA